jgi:hypothetical protein
VLVFVDESYDDGGAVRARSTFAALAIQERRYREFDMKLFDLKRHFWKVANPYDMELKGRKLLSERALTLPKNRDFIEQFITLCKEVGAVFFAVVQEGTFTLASESNKLPNLYRTVMRRVNTFMEDKYAEHQAIFFFDGIDHKTNEKIAISFNNFMYRHHWGQASKNILPTPFFCDSVVSPGIQIADVLAYCVNQRYGGRRGYLEDIFQKFRELAYNHADPDEGFTLWGICMVKPDEPATVLEKSVLLVKDDSVALMEQVIVEGAESEERQSKTETGDPEGPATPPVR